MSFKTRNAKDEEITCKFCHKPVAVNVDTQRIYELDQTTLYVNNCERRKAFFHNRAIQNAQSRRESRS